MGMSMKLIKQLKQLDLQVEKGEKTPLLFPRVLEWYPETILSPPRKDGLHRIPIHVEEKVYYRTGDYRFTQWPNLVGAERKCGLDEIGAAFAGGDRSRVADQLSRMVETYQYPLLYLEISMAEIYGTHHGRASYARIMDRVYNTVAGTGDRLILCNSHGGTKVAFSKRRKGELLLRRMVSYLLYALLEGEQHQGIKLSHRELCNSIMGTESPPPRRKKRRTPQ